MVLILGKYAALVWGVYVPNGTSDPETHTQPNPVNHTCTDNSHSTAACQHVYLHTQQYKYSLKICEPWMFRISPSCDHLLIPLFQHFMTGTEEYGLAHVTGASPFHLSCYCTDHPQLSQSLYLNTRLFAFIHYGIRFSFNHLMCFYASKRNLYYVKNELQCFSHFRRWFYTLITGVS